MMLYMVGSFLGGLDGGRSPLVISLLSGLAVGRVLGLKLNRLPDFLDHWCQKFLPPGGAQLAAERLIEKANRARHWAECHPLDRQAQQVVSRQQLDGVNRYIAAILVPSLGGGKRNRKCIRLNHSCAHGSSR